MDLRSPLARARGLGSAKEGVNHWWAQRVTAIALVPLALWFVISLLAAVGADHATVVNWIGHPVNTVLMVALLVAMFYHSYLGLQVVIEDYVHTEGVKLAALLIVKFLVILLGAACALAVLRIAFGG
jgi:succinate dehydrogenase / fumarate reductase membrane anchor subunit